jgi:hypothetical protein
MTRHIKRKHMAMNVYIINELVKNGVAARSGLHIELITNRVAPQLVAANITLIVSTKVE